MKGFGIYVKNDLLDPKHYHGMKEAIWLYLWLLESITSIDENGLGKVLYGMPIESSRLKEELDMSKRSYQRYLSILRTAGYINTKRTPYGLVITVNKAVKIFKNRSVKMALLDVEEPKRDVPRLVKEKCQNGTSNNNNTYNNTYLLTNVSKETSFGKPEINELVDYWNGKTRLVINSRVQQNRNAANTLLKLYGLEKTKQLIDGAALALDDRYAPTISDLCQLRDKTNELLAWGRKRTKNNHVEVIS